MDRFVIRTLVDVTQTGARRGEDSEKVKQQANFMTLYQVIGLRTNPVDFVIEKVQGSYEGFGSNYKNIKCYWEVSFTVEQANSLTIEMLQNDFDLVPFIDNLEECVNFKNSIFITSKNTLKNIIFEHIDK